MIYKNIFTKYKDQPFLGAHLVKQSEMVKRALIAAERKRGRLGREPTQASLVFPFLRHHRASFN